MIKVQINLVILSVCFPCILMIILPSCTHEPVTLEGLDTVCFNTQVMPLLQTSCGITGCHGGSEEDFKVTDYQSVIRYVTPGDPRNSNLYKVITDINGENMMPPDMPLTRQQRTIIQVWISQGALETSCSDTSGHGGNGGSDSICFVQHILPIFSSGCGTTGCHDAISHNDGYILTDYASIIKKGIVPFSANSSEIIEVVTEDGEDRMPPAPRSPLSESQISALRKWINDGALKSDCPDMACDTLEAISFSNQINPLLQTNCVGCHNSTQSGGGINLSTYNQVMTNAQTLRNGIPLLSGVIRKLSAFKPMPPSFTLDECNIRKMELWIEQGAMNN